MHLLAVHAERFSFAAETPANEASDPDAAAETPADVASAGTAAMTADLGACVVVAAAVERGDGATPAGTAAAAAAECRAVVDRLGESRVALVPTDHLTDSPAADAADAVAVLRSLVADLAADGQLEIVRAPVGWHLAVELEKRGHPFAAQSLDVDPVALRAPTTGRSLRLPDGERLDPEDAGARLPDAVAATVEAVANEADDSRRTRLPRDLLAETGLVVGDRTADERPHWLPRGAVARDALAARADDCFAALDAAPVETPAGVGPLATAPDTLDDLPWRRAERSRDVPAAVAVVESGDADAELRRQAAVVARAVAALGSAFLPVVRARGERADALAADLAADIDAPVLAERRDDGGERTEVEFHPVGATWPGERPRVARDDASAGRFDVALADGGRPAVVRCAPLGSLAGAVATAVERGESRDPPRLPAWLAPTQVRFVPVAAEHADRCDALAADCRAQDVRADVDARAVPVGERLERAERDRVPYYVVVGDREGGSEAVPVTDRVAREQRKRTVDGLCETILAEIADRPRPRRTVPGRVGER
ncbi:hypothetical protein DMJ13_03945 [halophilic archaeon]|nr:hypothetical protein DMJ13_03945 [halophilic archaeon]